jgi:hypothetical protein
MLRREALVRTPSCLAVIALFVALGCDEASTFEPAPDLGDASLRFVNGFGAAVDVFVDGLPHETGITNGAFTTIPIDAGVRTIAVRPVGGTLASGMPVQLADGAVAGLAAVRTGGGGIQVQALDDTNAVVPAGASKLRVLHLAALVGEAQVWRTQPDFPTPVRWAFPFTYNSVNTYFQSTPGRWEVRVWTDTTTFAPGNPSGWAIASAITSVTLGDGAKKTIAILDRPGGGIRLQVID